MIIGNIVGGKPLIKSYILETEDGQEIPAVLTSQEVVFTATPNDIREGKVAATGSGVVIGEKVIPSYHTCQGSKVVLPGETLSITNLTANNNYDYTKLQVIVCLYNTTLSDSVAAEVVAIDDGVFNVRSIDSISNVTKDHKNKSIELGITNNFEVPCVIRYFTYKEIE